jgi:hypothetical protein
MIVNRRYPGTTPFEKEQKDIFFGRERDIVKLTELIKFEPLLLLYSKSGLGKSSLLNAGVQPKLEQEKNTHVINIRFTRYTEGSISPIDNIISKLDFNKQERSLLDRIIAGENSLWYHFKKDYLQMVEPQKYILIFDQFEELFSYPKKQIYQFKKQLADLLYVQIPQHYRDELHELLDLDPDFLDDEELEKLYKPLDISVVTAIRSDKMSQMNELTDYLPTILKNFYELQPLDRERAKDAIINPAKTIGEFLSDPFKYEHKLLDKILDYLTEKDTKPIETFQLQIICARAEIISIRKKKKNPEIEVSIVNHEELKDLKNIFAQHYSETINTIAQTDQQIAARKLLEDKLIVDDNRVSLPEVLLLKEEGIDSEIINHLVNSRILRAEPNSLGGLSYELSHDTLVEPILAARKIRIEKEEADLAEAERKEELRKAKLKAENDRIEYEKKRRQERKINIIIVIAAFFSIGFGIFGFVNMKIARTEQARTKQLSIKGNMRDAKEYVDKEEYEVALQKYMYLRDTILEGNTTEGIEERITLCKKLDSISKIFYAQLQIADSLSSSNNIKDLIVADSLINSVENLDYENGADKLESIKTLFEKQVNNIIDNRLRIAEMQISAGVREDAVETVKKLNLLAPGNEKIINFIKLNQINLK